jgi:hypothetical protein
VRFEWDSGKAAINRRKHHVAFDEAVTAFYDALATTFDDPDHSAGEARFVTVGYSAQGRLLVVCHTERHDVVRIITARVATTREKKRHET